MFFKDIPGKADEKEFLLTSINEERIPHAQLFLGRRGTGQLALALAYSSYILCQNKTDGDSCGTCPACIKSHKYIHPDIHFSFPVIKKDGKQRKDTTSVDFLPEWRSALGANPYMDVNSWLHNLQASNEQANINVKECNDIIQKLGLKTFESNYKILIMWMPEYLRNEGNRLLKLIEEPTDNTIIILVAEKQEEILNTVLSRTQLLKVTPFTDTEITQYLENTFHLATKDAEQLCGLADGNMNMAVQLARNESINYRDALLDWLRASYQMEPIALGKLINDMAKWGRENQKHFLEYGLHFFREFIFTTLTNKESQKLNQEEKESMKKLGSLLNIDKMESIVLVINDCISAISRNANPKILFLTESLRIGRIMRTAKAGDKLFYT